MNKFIIKILKKIVTTAFYLNNIIAVINEYATDLLSGFIIYKVVTLSFTRLVTNKARLDNLHRSSQLTLLSSR